MTLVVVAIVVFLVFAFIVDVVFLVFAFIIDVVDLVVRVVRVLGFNLLVRR